MNSDEYRYLHECGADYVTVFQETYDSDKYETLHLAGHKRIFPYRINAQERALKGGMRGVGFGALLGLRISGKTPMPPASTPGCCSGSIPMRRSLFPAPGSVPLSTTTRSTPWTSMRPSCCR